MRFINQFSTVVHALLLFFFVMLVVIGCFYPGTLNLDSEWQLIQANQNIYHNGHPPLMSYIWHCLNLLFKTNSHLNMLVLIGSLFGTSLILIAYAEQSSIFKRWLFVIFSLSFLPMLLMIGFIIKDSLMAVSLLLTYAILLHSAKIKSLFLFFLSLIPLFIAFSTRHNSIFAIFPFAVWYGLLLMDILHITKYRMITCFITIIFLISSLFLANQVLVFKILQASNSHASQFLLAYDLVGVSVRTKENYLPSFYETNDKQITDTYLENMYRPYSNYYVFWGDESTKSTLNMISNDTQKNILIKQWMKAALSHPQAMLSHKIESYFSALGLKHKYYQLKANELNSPFNFHWEKIVPHQLMDGWIYLLGLMLFFIFQKQFPFHQKILLYSGFLYGLSWIACTPNAEQRYFFWVIMSFTILLMGYIVTKIKPNYK